MRVHEDELKILRVGILTPVEGLDPRQGQEHAAVLVMHQLFEAPFEFVDAPRPALFSDRLTRSQHAGGFRYRGRVRAGAKFSDGTPVTAAQVARCLDAVESVKDIARVSADGEDVCFDTERSTQRLEALLGLRWSSVVLEKDGRLLGTGPYEVASCDAKPRSAGA